MRAWTSSRDERLDMQKKTLRWPQAIRRPRSSAGAALVVYARQLNVQEPETDGTLTYAALERVLSPERLARYRVRLDDTDVDVIARYLWNVDLCDALLPSLHFLEVCLRNRLNVAIAGIHGADWYTNDEIIRLSEQRDDVKRALAILARDGKPNDPPRVVAALGFGFWTALFKRSYEWNPNPLWPKHIGAVLPNLNPYGALPGRGRGRAAAEGRLDLLRKLRNRISHHEPIWQGQKVGVGAPRRPLIGDHESLIEAIGWLSLEARTIAMRIDRFPDVYRRGYAGHLSVAGEMLQPAPPDPPDVGEVT